MSQSLPVTFFCPQPSELARLDGATVEETVEYWTVPKPVRIRVWVVQTVLRLREAGYEVEIQPTLPDKGIVVLLPEPHFVEAFLSQFEPRHRGLLIATIRADIVGFRSPIADAEIVQNGYFADGKRIFDVPHWPQPGLIPRDPQRGTDIRTIAFKGDRGNLHSDLFSERFQSFLNERGIEARLEETEDRTKPQPWYDFGDTDLLIAVRKPWHAGDLFYNKPASKLINAWHAGIPALLGPEYAFQELRQDSLDYMEISSDREAMNAIDFLVENPFIYEAMVRHGRERAQDFTVERVTQRWADILFREIPRIAQERSYILSRRLPLFARRGFNMCRMPPSTHEAWKLGGYVYRTIRRSITS